MHSHIQALFDIAAKPARKILGLMSGTSLDGLDIALCEVSGDGLDTQVKVLEFTTVNYDDDYKKRVKQVFSKRNVDLQEVVLLNPWIAQLHGKMINSCLDKWQLNASDVDVIASHGQTIFHSPKRQHGLAHYPNGTLQIGDGDHLAVTTSIITLSDFRQKHIAAGGEGAPLAVYGDYLLFSSKAENRIMLNIGGIANFTFLPQSLRADEVFSSDIGPGNTLMDAFIQKHYPQKHYDENSQLAKLGKVNSALLEALMQDEFFNLDFPKTTGPEVFNLAYLHKAQRQSQTLDLSHADIMATLNCFSASMIIKAVKQTTAGLSNVVLYASGGGIHNPLLMAQLSDALINVKIKTTKELGINPDAKEAVLFAVLANECLVGGKLKLANAREGIPNVTMGKVSFFD